MDDARLSADRSAIFAFFALNAIALPAGWFDSQAYPATSATTAFAGRGLLVAGGACVLFVVCEHPRWYRRHRTFVLSTLYTAMWLVLCTAQFYLLSWAERHNSVGTAASSIALGITLHLILPLNPKRVALDLSVICTILTMHAATAGYYLDAEPAKQFVGVLLIMMMSGAAVIDARLYRCVAWSNAQGQDDDDAAADDEDKIIGGKSVSETVRSRFRSREALDREKQCGSLLPEHKESRCLRQQLQNMQAECDDRHEKLATTQAECDEETRKLVASVKAHAETQVECDEEKAKHVASVKAHAETQVECDEEKAKLAASVKAHAETHAECDEEKAKLVASVKAHAETHAECDEEKAKLVASVKAHAETHAECNEEKAKLAASVKVHTETQVTCDEETAKLVASVKAHAETHAECDEEKAKLAASVKAHAETHAECDEETRKLVASVKAHAETHAECDEETRKLVASVKAHAETQVECDEEKAKHVASVKAHAETQVECDEETRKLVASVKAHAETHAECDEEKAKLVASVKAHAETHAECDEETRKLVASVKAHAETHAECDEETRKLVASVKAHAETQVECDEEKAKHVASVKAHALTQAEAESMSNRVINHTSKRVMCNTSLMCELALKQLTSFTLSGADDATRSELLERLRRTLAESIAGFHMCKSVLLHTSIITGEYHPVREEFTLEQLFEHLGLRAASRVVIDAADSRGMGADKALLTSILFNASQNALVHGEQGGTVHVGAVLSDGSPSCLTVTIRNAPGVNHAKLIAFTQAKGNVDLLAIRAGEGSAPSKNQDESKRSRVNSSELCKPSRELSKIAVGTVDSTYLGLGAILRDARAFNPPALTSLAIGAHEVAFSITLDVALVEHDASAAQTRVLPPGLVFVWLDDDDMPRIYADAVLRAAKANMEASLILGETYEEARTCLARVMELSAAHGEERMIVLLDQNIDQYHECATEGVLQGTEICREMRRRGFRGTIAICSANDEPKDEYKYLQAGANVSIGKGLAGGLSAILSKLADAHFETREALSTRELPLA
jgi:CheY-like chemotaxis protein